MTDFAGNARFSGAGAFVAVAFVLPKNSFATAPPEFIGELLAGNVEPDLPIPAGTSAPSDTSQCIAVRASDRAGGQQTGQAGQNFFFVEKLLAVVVGDKVQAHGTEQHGTNPTMIEGLSWFRINGIPACRQGHKANCGHATTGRSWWHMGGG